MSTISTSLSSERTTLRPIKEKTSQGWFVSLDVDYHTAIYLTRAEAVELFAALAAALKEETE